MTRFLESYFLAATTTDSSAGSAGEFLSPASEMFKWRCYEITRS
jgi:hypothetical protein